MTVTDEVLPAASSLLGVWVRERLRDEPIAWLTTVDARGVAQPNPVWYLWDGGSILVYNVPYARRLSHVRRRPQVTLHLDTHGQDGDAVVLIGTAEIVPGEPPADQQPALLKKYRDRMDMSRAEWASRFPVAIRIRPVQFRVSTRPDLVSQASSKVTNGLEDGAVVLVHHAFGRGPFFKTSPAGLVLPSVWIPTGHTCRMAQQIRDPMARLRRRDGGVAGG